MKKVSLVIGASTGIGLEITRVLEERGHIVIILSRRPELFSKFTAYRFDLSSEEGADEVLRSTFSKHEDIASIFLVSGTGDIEDDLDCRNALHTIDVNCRGFTQAVYHGVRHLEARGDGHLIAVTSVAAIRGGSRSMSYNASKAFQRSLLEGIRGRITGLRLPVTITEVRAGFVDTAMMKADKPFWVASQRQAANAIVDCVSSNRELIYVLGRWRLIGWLLTALPIWIQKRMG